VNAGKLGLGALLLPLGMIVVVLMTLMIGAQKNSTTATASRGGLNWSGISLSCSGVPAWACGPLQAAAAKYPKLPAPILAAQLQVESGWRLDAHNDDSGADGPAQFLPSTWTEWGRDGDGDGRADTRNGADAIASQTAYMDYLVSFVEKRPGLVGDVISLALASYNAGPGRVLDSGGIPPITETQDYVHKIRQLAVTKYAQVLRGSGEAKEVIAAAAAHVNKTMYSWGGGGLEKPTLGMPPDAHVVGFDCSSLVRYAFYVGTSGQIELPRVADAQYNSTRAQTVRADQLQPGDLLFWDWNEDGEKDHVALYIGDQQMIEAPQSGQLIRQISLQAKGGRWVATRVFGGPRDPKQPKV